MNRVLVTGISGFIGRATAKALSNRSLMAIGLDRHPKPVDGASFIKKGDVKERIWEMAPFVDGIIHLAGVLGTSELFVPEAVREAIDSNIASTAEVVLACQEHNTPLVLIGTGNKDWPSIYPITKESAIRIAQAHALSSELRLSVVRAFNAYGPWQKHAPVKKFIPNLVRWALLQEPCEIYGDGSQVMDPVWVGDVAEVLVAALLAAEEGSVSPTHIYEAGTGIGLSANLVSDIVWQALTGIRQAPKTYLPMRPGEPKSSTVVADTATLEPLRKYGIPSTLTHFGHGIHPTVEWYRQNPHILGLVL